MSFNQGSGIDISDTTAISGTVLQGYYFYTSDGTKTEGSVKINNASDITVVGTQTYQSGYYPTQWTVTGLDTSDADATASNIESGKIAYVNGVKIVGSAKIWHGLTKYTGDVQKLSVARREINATSLENYYAIFAAGENENSAIYTNVDAYNTSLTRSNPDALTLYRSRPGATSIGNYALFGGGWAGGFEKLDRVDAYNTSLTMSWPSQNLSEKRYWPAATTVGNYALFCGGSSNTNSTVVDAYNSNLIRSVPTALSSTTGVYRQAATSIKDYYALISFKDSTTVDAYNTSLSRSTPTGLSQTRTIGATTNIGEYALFGGGYASQYLDVVDVYNKSLTRSTASALTNAKYNFTATSIEMYALFAGGHSQNGTMFDIIDAYDTSLTKTIDASLSVKRYDLAGASINNYAIFAGGIGPVYNGSLSDAVEVYCYS